MQLQAIIIVLQSILHFILQMIYLKHYGLVHEFTKTVKHI